jgi:DNA-binding NarL/FixJ family response regulator
MDLAVRCGATAYADRAHAELLAAGARPRRDRRFLSGPESLTPGELRVARLAAEGLTDRAIAQRLYVTQAAVQFHLRNTFRKLQIGARGDLAAALSGPGAAKS